MSEKFILMDISLIGKIRELINKVENQSLLIKEKDIWNKLCSALDSIEDTANAVFYYIESDYPDSIGGKYLFTYGLLQAIFLQQDSLNSINLSLFNNEIDYRTNYPELYKIREIRNDVVGHPTGRKKDGKTFCIHLSQVSMSKDYFEYLVFSDNMMFERVSVGELINNQNKIINLILQNVVDMQNKSFREYIEMHKDRKIIELFKMRGYHQEKLLTNDMLYEYSIKYLCNIVEKVKEELNRRYDSWGNMNFTALLIKEIDEIYSLLMEAEIRENVRKYLGELFCIKIEELEKHCQEIDEYFESYGKN